MLLLLALCLIARTKLSNASTLDPSAMTVDDRILSEHNFQAFHTCMLESGFRFEDVSSNPKHVQLFLVCCSEAVYPDKQLPNNSHVNDSGADGRDIISMSAVDMETIFHIDATLSRMIRSFITRQLTASPPQIR